METATRDWGYIGMMDKNMETTIVYWARGFKFSSFVRQASRPARSVILVYLLQDGVSLASADSRTPAKKT